MAKTFSKEDVSTHSKPDNLWIIIDEDVYDLTKFQDQHPGGQKSMFYVFVVYIRRWCKVRVNANINRIQSFSEWPERMLQSSSGNITMPVF